MHSRLRCILSNTIIQSENSIIFSMKQKHSYFRIYVAAILLKAHALSWAGMGELHWSDDLFDNTGPSGLGLGDAVLPIAGFAVTWWLVLSEKSPVAKSGILIKLFVIFAGPMLTAIVGKYLGK